MIAYLDSKAPLATWTRLHHYNRWAQSGCHGDFHELRSHKVQSLFRVQNWRLQIDVFSKVGINPLESTASTLTCSPTPLAVAGQLSNNNG